MTIKSEDYFGKDLEAMAYAENYHEWILDEFRPHIGACVAEVGAGSGHFSECLIRSGIKNLYAFEPSRNMFPMLSQRFENSNNVFPINDFFEGRSQDFSEYFDSICYVNVLEHIEDDVTALRCAYAALRSGGSLLIFVPALPFLYSPLDKRVGHFRRYWRRNLLNVVISAGFSVEVAKYFDFFGVAPWYIAFVLMQKGTTAGNVSAYDKCVVPVARRLEKWLTPPIGKNVLLVARKH